MVVEGFHVPSSGKKHAVYRSLFSRVETNWEGGQATAVAILNQSVADRLRLG